MVNPTFSLHDNPLIFATVSNATDNCMDGVETNDFLRLKSCIFIKSIYITVGIARQDISKDKYTGLLNIQLESWRKLEHKNAACARVVQRTESDP